MRDIPNPVPNRKRSITATVICGAAVLILFAVMSALTDFPLVDTMWRASAAEIHNTVSTLTAGQIRAYRNMLAVDFLYAIAYTGLLVLLFRSCKTNQRFRGAIRRIGVTAAVTAGVSDYLENALILAVLAALPDTSPLARALGTVTTVKWVTVGTAAVLLGVLAVRAVLSRTGRRRSG